MPPPPLTPPSTLIAVPSYASPPLLYPNPLTPSTLMPLPLLYPLPSYAHHPSYTPSLLMPTTPLIPPPSYAPSPLTPPPLLCLFLLLYPRPLLCPPSTLIPPPPLMPPRPSYARSLLRPLFSYAPSHSYAPILLIPPPHPASYVPLLLKGHFIPTVRNEENISSMSLQRVNIFFSASYRTQPDSSIYIYMSRRISRSHGTSLQLPPCSSPLVRLV